MIDADKIAHVVTEQEECLARLTDEFGKDIIDNNGRLIRRRLADIVFNSNEKLGKLNRITHFYILKIINEKLDEYIDNKADVIMDVPLLFESGLDERCDVTIGVIADDSVITERIMRRDKIDFESAQKRIASQHGNEYFIEKSEYIIDAACTMEELEKQASELIVSLKQNNTGEKL